MENQRGNRRLRLGVIGLGSVGNALRHTLSFYHEVVGYDIRLALPWEAILNADVAFVCVSTPEGRDGRLDCANVWAVLARLASADFQQPVAVRSTVRLGFMAEAARAYPRLRLVYLPEFLRERSCLQWSVCPDRLVVGGDPRDCEVILSCFDWVEDAPRLRMTFREAELGKLAHNAFIATKVSFTNEVERICEANGASATQVMRVVTADRRVVSEEHLRPGLGPYRGSCVPKDTRELLVASGSRLLSAVEEVNNKLTAGRGPAKAAAPIPSKEAVEPGAA